MTLFANTKQRAIDLYAGGSRLQYGLRYRKADKFRSRGHYYGKFILCGL